MIVYRISSKLYISDLSGTGAMLYGGRWNQKGHHMLYTSESLSLAALEIVANLSSARLGTGLFCSEILIPDDLPIDALNSLPENWNTFPHTSETAYAGSKFLKHKGFCLKAPSSLIPTEYNYLLNPLHDEYHRVRILDSRPFVLDQRLIIK